MIAAARNGTVSNWGFSGVDITSSLGRGSLIERIIATDNGSFGLRCNEGGVVRNCAAVQNGSGISAFDNSLVEGCTAQRNTNTGISASSGRIVRGCTATANTQAGIATLNGCSVIDCAARSNGDDGIRVNDDCLVRSCTALSNGGDGVSARDRCTVVGNVCNGNGAATSSAGISAALDCRIEANTVAGNARGIHLAFAGNVAVRNTATANTTNYLFAAGNRGQIVQAASGPAVNGATGGAPIGSTDPWINFSY